VQQLGTAAASFIAGIIVVEGGNGKISRYNWLGYFSIVVLVICFFLARRLFKKMQAGSTANPLSKPVNEELAETV
jgi:hypothetical protein